MHIPDGFLNVPTLIVTQTVAIGCIGVSAKKIQSSLDVRRIPLLGLGAAFLFCLQLFSVPVPGGTSVHVSGVVLLAVLLGPHSVIVIGACSLALQALLFQHGGILSFGANFLTITLLPAWIGSWIYGKLNASSRIVALSTAILVGKILGAALCASILAVSSMVPFEVGLPAMVLANGLGAILESVICVGLLSFILTHRPVILEGTRQ